MPPQPFRVTLIPVAGDDLRDAVALAARRGQGEEVRQAARAIESGLRWMADELGESRYPLKVLGELRVAVIGPLGVLFSVHTTKREVVVSRFRLLGVRRRGSA